MNKILRKSKSILFKNNDDKEFVKVNITIESNHINNNLDAYLETIKSNVKSLTNYTILEPILEPVKIKKKKETKLEKKKRECFSNGSF